MPGDPVVGSTILRRPAIQSPNFVTTVSGWTINADGSAEFNNLVIRGTFAGTDFVINTSGAFFYSAAPAAGNLIASIAITAGTDSFGNHYADGQASYDNVNGLATSVTGGLVQFYTGSLAAGWTAAGSVQGDAAGDLLLTPQAGRGVLTSLNTLDDGAGNLTAGHLSSGGASNTTTNGLTNGTIAGTSGAASAGTAHTHGGGSYAVNNGTHHHAI